MDDDIRLKPSALVADRPFTHPERSAEDAAILGRMVDRVRLILRPSEGNAEFPRPFIFESHEAGERARGLRIIITRPEALLGNDDLTVVGFFGQKRPGAEAARLTAVDDELIGEFPQHPGVLSYCSLELEEGNWGNLVLLNPPEAREHWKTSARHAYAARELAPGYYTVIRLHNAVLPGGVLSGHGLILQRTKYYDFQGPTPWYAIREFQP